MRGPHLLIGTVSVLAIASGAAALVVDPSPITSSSSAMIAIGLIIVGITCLVGLLLARAPWGRWGLGAGVVVAMALASVGTSPFTWATYVVGSVAIVGLAGPWLRLWTRHHRLADAPGPVVVALASVAAVAPLYVGLAVATSGAGWLEWSVVTVAVVGSALYGKGATLGMWILRVGMPIVALLDAASLGGPAGVLVGMGGVVVGVLAWLPAASKATTVIAPVLPEPIERKR